MPDAIVSATAVPANAPTRLRIPAMMTAGKGRNTRVETTVAIEFGASVQPFANSKRYAMTRTIQTGTSALLQDDSLDRVRYIL